MNRFSTSAPTSVTASPDLTPAVLTLAPEEDEHQAEVAAPVVVPKDYLRPVTSVPGLIIACLVCLLIGSLLRSVLSEADFVIYPSSVDAVPETGHGEWRELKRLMEWRIGWDRDLIIAVARRR